jgi:hypothetical protein
MSKGPNLIFYMSRSNPSFDKSLIPSEKQKKKKLPNAVYSL